MVGARSGRDGPGRAKGRLALVRARAGEGGAWGIAVLAAYSTEHRGRSLTEFLAGEVFAGAELVTISPQPADVAGFEEFMRRYVAALPVQLAAIQHS